MCVWMGGLRSVLDFVLQECHMACLNLIENFGSVENHLPCLRPHKMCINAIYSFVVLGEERSFIVMAIGPSSLQVRGMGGHQIQHFTSVPLLCTYI